MTFHFATNERKTALKYLVELYPSYIITDTEDCAKPILDLAEADIMRIQDPAMHNPANIIPATNWNETKRTEILKICNDFHNNLKLK